MPPPVRLGGIIHELSSPFLHLLHLLSADRKLSSFREHAGVRTRQKLFPGPPSPPALFQLGSMTPGAVPCLGHLRFSRLRAPSPLLNATPLPSSTLLQDPISKLAPWSEDSDDSWLDWHQMHLQAPPLHKAMHISDSVPNSPRLHCFQSSHPAICRGFWPEHFSLATNSLTKLPLPRLQPGGDEKRMNEAIMTTGWSTPLLHLPFLFFPSASTCFGQRLRLHLERLAAQRLLRTFLLWTPCRPLPDSPRRPRPHVSALVSPRLGLRFGFHDSGFPLARRNGRVFIPTAVTFSLSLSFGCPGRPSRLPWPRLSAAWIRISILEQLLPQLRLPLPRPDSMHPAPSIAPSFVLRLRTSMTFNAHPRFRPPLGTRMPFLTLRAWPSRWGPST